MACLVIVTAVKTLSRNEVRLCCTIVYVPILMFWFQFQDWSSDLALFQSGVKVNPNNVKLRNNLAMELKSAGRLEEAQHHYLVCYPYTVTVPPLQQFVYTLYTDGNED